MHIRQKEGIMKRPLLWLAGAFALGIALAVCVSMKICLCFCGAAMGLTITQYVRVTTGKSRVYLLFPVFVLAGGMYAQADLEMVWLAQTQAEAYFQTTDAVEGTVAWIDLGTEEKQTQIRLENLACGGEELVGSMLMYLEGEAGEELQIGWRIQAWGQAEIMEEANNPGGFDAKSYYAAQGVYYRMYGDGYEVISAKGDKMGTALLRLRRTLKEKLQTITDPSDASVFAAMLLGDQRLLSEELREAYQLAGIAHVLAISGLHLSILGMGLFRILRKCGASFLISGSLSALVMGSFTYLTGASTSCLRAYIMFFMMLLANYTGRTYDTPSAMSLAVLLLLLEQPLRLFQSGFLLSFGAIVAIAGVAPILLDFVVGTQGKPGKFVSSLMFSLAVQIITAPISAWFFYRISVWGPVFNLVVIPLMSLLMGSLLLALACSYTPLANLAGWAILPAEWTLELYDVICACAKVLPGGLLITGRPRVAQVVGYSVILGVFLLGGRKWNRRRKKEEQAKEKKETVAQNTETVSSNQKSNKKYCLAMVICLSIWLPTLLVRGRSDCVEVVMLDVGQGDGLLIMMPQGTTALLDGGSTTISEVYDRVLLPALQYYGVEKIDMWFLTHPDKDHISGFMEYQENPGEIALGTVVLPESGEHELLWQEVLAEYQGTVQYLSRGLTLHLYQEAVEIQCLSPRLDAMPEEVNDVSMVLRLCYGNQRILFCGDISEAQEELLLAWDRDLQAEVLKVAHHGSKYSSSAAFLEAVSASHALISVGKNLYGHPTPEALQRLEDSGATVYQTLEHGAWIVTLWKAQEKVEVEAYREK